MDYYKKRLTKTICFLQVWFQNRRMKDKRQRMAMAWPYGIADPHLYAYLAAAAASYPYGLPQSTPLNYYSSLGMPRSPVTTSPNMGNLASNLGQYPFPNPLRPRPEVLPGMASTFLRTSSLQHPLHSSPIHAGCNPHSLDTSPLLNTSGTLNSSGSSCSPPLDDSCCNSMLGGVSTLPHSPHQVSPLHSSPLHSTSHHHSSPHHSSSQHSSPVISSPQIQKPQTSTPHGLFRPFQTDIERT